MRSLLPIFLFIYIVETLHIRSNSLEVLNIRLLTERSWIDTRLDRSFLHDTPTFYAMGVLYIVIFDKLKKILIITYLGGTL